MGLLSSQYMEKYIMFQTTNQGLFPWENPKKIDEHRGNLGGTMT
jgi:hypothetical protein